MRRRDDRSNAKLMLLNRFPPSVLVLTAIVSIQLGSALAVTLFSVYEPLGILFLRQAIGGIFLCLLYGKALAGALRQAPMGIVLLGLAMTAMSIAFYESIARIPLGLAVTIEFVGPLGVALIASRRLVDFVCALLAAAGIVLLTPAVGTTLDPAGVLFAFGAAAGWACFILLSRCLGQSLKGGVGLALAMQVSAVILLPMAGLQALSDAMANATTIIAILGVAIFSAAIPFLLEFLALGRMPARQYGVVIALEPVVATVIGIALLAETIEPRAWIAITLISLASIGIAVLGKPVAPPDQPV